MSKITKEIINKRKKENKSLDLYYKTHSLLTRQDLGFSALAQAKTIMNSLVEKHKTSNQTNVNPRIENKIKPNN